MSYVGSTVTASTGTNGQNAPASSDVVGFNNGGVTQQAGTSNPLPTLDQTLQGAQSTDAPINVSITGDPNGDFAGVNLLEQVMSDNTGLAFNTRTLNPPKLDANNAAIPSDAPPSTILYLGINVPQTIDTTGYQTVVFQQQAAVAITIAHSNDGVNFQSVLGTALTGTSSALSATTTATVNLIYAFPIAARYMRFTAASATSVVIYLRQTPFASYMLSAGTSTTTTLGNIPAGTTASGNPVTVGGSDYNSIVRRIQTDTNGNAQVVGQLPIGYQVGQYNVTYTSTTASTNPITATLASVNPVMVGGTDNTGAARRLQTDMFGAVLMRGAPATPSQQSIEDLLTQILGVLRVLTHYKYEEQLLAGFRSTADEPDTMLADYLNPASTLINMTN